MHIASGLPRSVQRCFSPGRECSTSGMGLGLGRMLTWLLDLHSIRQVVAFPRFPGYVRP